MTTLQLWKNDAYAACLVALLLIPQAIAYAMIAGVPAVYGLYASIFPLLVYSLVGSSPLLSVGPVAVVSVMVYTGLTPLAFPGSPLYLALVAFLTLSVGLLQVFFAVVRLGTLFRYVPHSVMRGFINALALTIILHQVSTLTGISFQSELPFLQALADFGRKLVTLQQPVFLFSCLLIVLYVFLRRSRVPSPSLLLVVISSLVVFYFHLEHAGIEKVGAIQSGWPAWDIPDLLVAYVPDILPLAFFIALISFLESYTMAVQLQSDQPSKLDPNQELFALGLANVTGSLVQAFPVAGAFSRSAVNRDARARTRMASLLTALFVLLLSVYFTMPLTYLPLPALAVIIIFAAYRLIHWRSIGTHPIVLITTLSCLTLGLKMGFCIGIGASLLWSYLSSPERRV
ncbi:SulP family inorganic anion transporter [Alteribacillus iranensis]|uniref:Sulfate permease, SulP family n=1 Tax=Alteribacillus iranensis TaxID=930128 RepID=A0A1I2C046_9BACI|nr:SulP family inorganic anion transporter [Alteribacillus iranensis]SFE61751.1 sulfate permease, SulP family [Alteribacillus iranensis]